MASVIPTLLHGDGAGGQGYDPGGERFRAPVLRLCVVGFPAGAEFRRARGVQVGTSDSERHSSSMKVQAPVAKIVPGAAQAS